MTLSAKSVMFSVFVIIIFFRYLLYHNHGNECHVSHVPCICYYYFISGIYFTIIMAISAMSVMFSVFVIIIFFRYLLYHNHGNECHVSHVPCICYNYFISGIHLTIIMPMSAMSVMFSVFLIIILFQIFTLP